MEWFKSPSNIQDWDCDNELIGIWCRVCGWMVSQEMTSPVIPEKRPRSYPLSSEEHQKLMNSHLIEGRILTIHPCEEVKSIKAQREAGKKGGRPRKGEVKTPGLKGGAKPDKIREDKIREDKIDNDDAHPDFLGDDSSNEKQAPPKWSADQIQVSGNFTQVGECREDIKKRWGKYLGIVIGISKEKKLWPEQLIEEITDRLSHLITLERSQADIIDRQAVYERKGKSDAYENDLRRAAEKYQAELARLEERYL